MSTDPRFGDASHEKLRLILEAMPSGIVVVEPAGKIVLVNGRLADLFGYSREEMIGQPIELLVPERFRGKHVGYRDGFLANPRTRPMGLGRDLFGVRKDGTEFPVEIGLNPVETSEGLFVLSAITDITERKRLEERFRATVESAPTAMVMIDASGKIMLVNRETEKLFSYQRGELLGRPVEVLVPERFRTGHPQLRDGFFAAPQARRMGAGRDLFGQRKDGSEFPVEIGLNPVETSEGVFVLAGVVDISERKRDRNVLEAIHHAQTQFIIAEAPLAIFEEFLQSLVALTDSEYGFIDEMFYDSDGKPFLTARAITDISWSDESRKMYQQFVSGTLNFANLQSLYGEVMKSGKPVIANDAPHDLRRTGIPAGHPPLKAFLGLPLLSNSREFVGVIGLANRPGGYNKDVTTYLEPMVAACANLIAARKNDQRRQQAEQDLRRARDDLELRVQARTTELQAQRRAALNLAQDAEEAKRRAERNKETLAIVNRELQGEIAQRQRTEEELRRITTELARSNAELEQFAYIASHDLQEPLRKVQSFGDLLVMKYLPSMDEQAQHYVNRMQDGARRMQGLINDLLTYARVTSQAKPFVPVDLARVVREVMADLETRVKASSGRVEIRELPHLETDPLQMRQLLQNLIGNALKFHRPDVPPVIVVAGRVIKNGDSITLEHSRSDQICEITVQDNGIGFEEKYLDRIFAPFQRLHGRGEYEGTGIGLAICRKIVERHGGTITARSIPGQGATFIVLLPLHQPKGKNRDA
jgi:PAS domain S-box-containing protein